MVFIYSIFVALLLTAAAADAKKLNTPGLPAFCGDDCSHYMRCNAYASSPDNPPVYALDGADCYKLNNGCHYQLVNCKRRPMCIPPMIITDEQTCQNSCVGCPLTYGI